MSQSQSAARTILWRRWWWGGELVRSILLKNKDKKSEERRANTASANAGRAIRRQPESVRSPASGVRQSFEVRFAIRTSGSHSQINDRFGLTHLHRHTNPRRFALPAPTQAKL
jgi:hypothetical protein